MVDATPQERLERLIGTVCTVVDHALDLRYDDFDFDNALEAVADARAHLTLAQLDTLPGSTEPIIQAYRDVLQADNASICWALSQLTPAIAEAAQALRALAVRQGADVWISLVVARHVTHLWPGTFTIMIRTMSWAGAIELARHTGDVSRALDDAAIVIGGHKMHQFRFRELPAVSARARARTPGALLR